MTHRTVRNDLQGCSSAVRVFFMPRTLVYKDGIRTEIAELARGESFDIPNELDHQAVFIEVPANLVCVVRVGPKIVANRAISYGEPTGGCRSVTVRNDFAAGIFVRVFHIESSTFIPATGEWQGGGPKDLANLEPGEIYDVPEDIGWPPIYVELHSQLVAEAVIASKIGWGRKA